MSDARVTAAKERVRSAQAELSAAKDELHQAEIAASPFKIGQIWARETTKGWGNKKKTVTERGQVTRFILLWGDTRAELSLFKMDGTLGQRTRTIYTADNWRLETAP